VPLHTSLYLMLYIIQSLQRDLGEWIHKLGSSSWGIRVQHISRCGRKLGKQLIDKKFNIASRVVRHARPQHNCILKSSLFSSCLFYYSYLLKYKFFLLPILFYTLFYCLQIGYFPMQVQTKYLWTRYSIFCFNLYYLW